MKTKTLDASLETDGIKVDAVISTESIDRDGEVLIAQGMDSSEYDANPVVFYNHDYGQPVGQVTNLRRGRDKVEATIKFAKRPDDFQGSYFPEFVESLVEQGIVKGISVGFVSSLAVSEGLQEGPRVIRGRCPAGLLCVEAAGVDRSIASKRSSPRLRCPEGAGQC